MTHTREASLTFRYFVFSSAFFLSIIFTRTCISRSRSFARRDRGGSSSLEDARAPAVKSKVSRDALGVLRERVGEAAGVREERCTDGRLRFGRRRSNTLSQTLSRCRLFGSDDVDSTPTGS